MSRPPHRILFTIPNFITAGSGRAMLNIIERLDRTKFAPSVCVSQKGGALDLEVEALGIPLMETSFTVSARPYHSLPARAWQAAQVFRPYRFDIWHSFHYLDDYTEPIIARLAGARAWVFTKKNMSWGSRAWFLRSLFATRIAAQNNDMLGNFFDRWPLRNRARLVPTSVDVGEFRPRSPAVSGYGKVLNIPESAVIAGCVAHLVPIKGHPTLLRAVAGVPGIHLLVAGKPLDQKYAHGLERLAGELGVAGRVHFLGDVDDVPTLLSELDIAILPTSNRGEGCPVALLEAMAAGVACIATDVPGSRDVVEDGISGVLVPPDDAAALADALSELAASEQRRRQMARDGRDRILAEYRLDREVRDYVSIYNEALNVG